MDSPPPPPPPPPPRSYRLITLILKLLTIVFLLTALVVLTTDTVTDEHYDNSTDGNVNTVGYVSVRMHFKDINSYRYLLSTCVIGMAYTLLQIVFSFYHISTGNNLSSPTFDFYGDKVLSYTLATGAAAGFAATSDLRPGSEGVISHFFNRGYAASALVLLGFVCAAFLSIFSSRALPKKV
ncbi:hypothetical protein SLEP1_g5734 [Rubroshorea leprosula]|uniref:CASP-like protein n=1 Tax=Rubroshorea leprosula TaxID=152421 RepID=A0AAV5I3I1_9ROSI|nr:hypothetical protein SLEP1_g5734 [Rubroshorea leprosula]